VNDTLLASWERAVLRWLCEKAPDWVTPDFCTAAGVAGAAIAAVAYGLSNISVGFLWLATFGIAVNWAGDSLDGSIARFRAIERPQYGFFIDHVCDAVCQILIFLGLGLSPYVNFSVACLALIGYATLAIIVYIRACVVGEFKISYGKLGPTEARVLVSLLNSSMFFFGRTTITLRGVSFSVYDIAVGAFGTLAFAFFAVMAWKETIRLRSLGQ
jgi:archaetidylinositol phosphate synthase